jgi:hypothetical protein
MASKLFEKLIVDQVFRHYKGNLYKIVAKAKCSDTERDIVVYRELYGQGNTWVRDASVFFSDAPGSVEGKMRFELVDRPRLL